MKPDGTNERIIFTRAYRYYLFIANVSKGISNLTRIGLNVKNAEKYLINAKILLKIY